MQRFSTSLGRGLSVSGLLQGWIGCLNSQEWCSRLQALHPCALLFTLFSPYLSAPVQPRLCRVSGKVCSPGRWSFHLLLPQYGLIKKQTHCIHLYIRCISVGRGSLSHLHHYISEFQYSLIGEQHVLGVLHTLAQSILRSAHA